MSRRRLLVIAGATVTVALATFVWAMGAARRDVQVSRLAAEPGVLLGHEGEPFAMQQLLGKTVVLNFIFTHCPSVCPLQTEALARVQQGLPSEVRERVQFVSVSIDPENDTPEAMKAFGNAHHADLAHWTFVTGPRDELAALSTAYSAQALPPGAEPLDHRTEVRLINAQGKLLQTYTGSPLDEPRLIREIQTVDQLFNQER